MSRRARVAPGGLVYHVLNRTVAGLPLFRKEADFEAHERHPTQIVAWCLMRNHWHFLLWPREEGERLRVCIARNRPYGNESWQQEQAKQLGLLHTMRSEGRPKAIGGTRNPRNSLRSRFKTRPRFKTPFAYFIPLDREKKMLETNMNEK